MDSKCAEQKAKDLDRTVTGNRLEIPRRYMWPEGEASSRRQGRVWITWRERTEVMLFILQARLCY